MNTHLRLPRRGRFRALVATLAVATLSLSACGGSADQTTSDGTTSVSGAASEAPTLRLGLTRAITNVHPHKGGSADSQGSIIGSIYEALTKVTVDGEAAPSLAAAWEQLDDLTWTFTIRPDATFSDGTPVTAQDVAWNFEKLLDKEYVGTAGASLRKFTSSVTATSDDTVTFSLAAPAIDLPSRLWNLYIVSPAYAESGANLDLTALGSGPYVLDDLDLENGARLSANPYWTGTRPDFDTVDYLVLASEAQRVAAVQAHEVDIVLNLAPLSTDGLGGDDSTVILEQGAQPFVLAINERKSGSPLAEATVRQALNYATDKQSIIDALLKSAVVPLPGQVLFEPYGEQNPDLSAYPYDPTKARELLSEAGYSDGLQLELDVPSGTYVAAEAAAQAIAAQWAEVGITLTLTVTPFPAWVERQQGDDDQASDLVYINWGGSSPTDLNGKLGPFTSTHIQGHVDAPNYDAFYDQALKATTWEERQTAINEALRVYHDEAHTVFLYASPFTGVVSKSVTWEPRAFRYLYAYEVGRA
ncbi:ABC transporter substrate-binding protein [Nakamurella leprariae]|uniref:ABC transporter substrate-binding protein n=1 Tax=Nakamurella leprariae TaxID=2803911 RepID=A0A938YCI0_9ACTN|nr:ABC transporter substrate-binding protein [Nakamurella leprariae]MBM9465674.1 ABC transporter substrate-binding protein [Nakamurella leprariae]